MMNEKILIIDDEEDILALLSATLKAENYEVVTAVNGKHGLEQFKECVPDLVVTDVRMPKMDGLEVLKKVKELNPDTDVIILTGHSDETTAIECLRSGAYDYLIKPLEDLDILLKAINRALEKKNLKEKNRQLVKKLKEMAVRDPLTGLHNFRCLQTHLDEELIRSERYGHTFCGLLLDIDHFKTLNDTYGHLFGDHVLKKLGELMLRELRSADRLYRYGGEEFFILMPETPKEKAISAVHRTMEAIRKHTFAWDGHQAGITVSMGGCVFPDQARDKTELIRQADQALYQAKEAGRDRVIFDFAAEETHACKKRIQACS